MLQQLEHVTLLNPTCQNVQQPVCCPHINEGIYHLVQSTAQICVAVWCNCCKKLDISLFYFHQKNNPHFKITDGDRHAQLIWKQKSVDCNALLCHRGGKIDRHILLWKQSVEYSFSTCKHILIHSVMVHDECVHWCFSNKCLTTQFILVWWLPSVVALVN